MRIVFLILSKITGNPISQKLLRFVIKGCLKLMGIGSGAGVSISGEKVVIKRLQSQISDSSEEVTVLDGEANNGEFAAMILDSVKDGNLKIHCFEPGNGTFKLLQKKLVNASNVTLNNLGLGKISEKRTLYYNVEGSGLASLSNRDLRHHNIEFSKSEEVELVTIDDYCEANKIESVHLLKLDIEGHELSALHGASRSFKGKKIKMVSFEFGGAAIDSKCFFREIYYFLTEYGFKVFKITPTGYLVHITTYSASLEMFLTTNYLAIGNDY